MEYKGKLYAKINGKYVECTESVQDLENQIEELKNQINILNSMIGEQIGSNGITSVDYPIKHD